MQDTSADFNGETGSFLEAKSPDCILLKVDRQTTNNKQVNG